jgi:hypothetical protein
MQTETPVAPTVQEEAPSNKRVVPNSAIYRRKIKRMVEATKSLRGLARIPKGYPLTVKASADGKVREDFTKAKNSFLTIDTLHYFADQIRVSTERRNTTQMTAVTQELSGKDPKILV